MNSKQGVAVSTKTVPIEMFGMESTSTPHQDHVQQRCLQLSSSASRGNPSALWEWVPVSPDFFFEMLTCK